MNIVLLYISLYRCSSKRFIMYLASYQCCKLKPVLFTTLQRKKLRKSQNYSMAELGFAPIYSGPSICGLAPMQCPCLLEFYKEMKRLQVKWPYLPSTTLEHTWVPFRSLVPMTPHLQAYCPSSSHFVPQFLLFFPPWINGLIWTHVSGFDHDLGTLSRTSVPGV